MYIVWGVIGRGGEGETVVNAMEMLPSIGVVVVFIEVGGVVFDFMVVWAFRSVVWS